MMDIEQALELEAGRELDRVVAEMLGWTDIEETTYWIDDYDGSVEVTAWEGIPPGERWTRLAPHYSTDANAALSLVSDVSNGVVSDFRLVLVYDGWSISWEAFYRHHRSEADTPALAIVRARLAYHKAVNTPVPDDTQERVR